MGPGDFSVTSNTPELVFSVTGEPGVSTGFEAGFLALRMGTADFSVTSNTRDPATLQNR